MLMAKANTANTAIAFALHPFMVFGFWGTSNLIPAHLPE